MHARQLHSGSARAHCQPGTAARATGSAPRRHSLTVLVHVGLVAIGLLSAASAASATDGGVYVGAQVIGARHASGGDGDVSGGVTLGFGVSEFFGVEASYKKTQLDYVSVLPGNGGGIQGVELALRGSRAINNWFGLTAKAGAYQWRASEEVANGPERGTDAVVGAGLQFRVSDQVMLSTEYEKILGFDGLGEDDHVSIGVRFDFD
jgi:opacity protein-like surface antigen